jgi:hypothetical protein
MPARIAALKLAARAEKKAGGRRTANGIGKEKSLMPQPLRLFIRSVLPIALFMGLAPSVEASHLTMDLTVEGSPRAGHASTDTMPPANGKNPRPVVHSHAGDAVKLRWRVKNADAHKKLEKLLVHLFIVPEAQAGQKEVPDPRKGSVWETVFATALDPGKETHGELEVPVSEPGTYLVRVESMFTEQDHEHFAAVDLVVE